MANQNLPAVIDQINLAALNRIDQDGLVDLSADTEAMMAIELVASEVVMRAKAGIPIIFTLEPQDHSGLAAVS